MKLLFFLELWNQIPIFMEQILGKKDSNGEKVTIIFPFFPQMVNPKILLYLRSE
jgi:hypothetical protein